MTARTEMGDTVQDNVIEGLPLSLQQRRLWQLGGREGLRSCCAVLIEGWLDRGAAADRLRGLVSRHEILRTTFRSLPGMALPVQVILDSPVLSYAEVDLTGEGGERQQERIEELLGAEELFPLDLEKGPLVRVLLAALAPDRHILALRLPALCADSRTLANLLPELGAALAGLPADGEEEPVQYADFSGWLEEWSEGEEGVAARDYWQAQDLSLPAGLPADRPAAATGRRATVVRHLAREGVAALAGRGDTTEEVVLLGCWQTLLWRLRGGEGVVIGHRHDGRRFRQLRGALGPFAVCVPVRCPFEEDMEFLEVLQAVAEAVQAARGRQEGFLCADPNGPRFPVLFACEERPAVWERGGLRLAPLWLHDAGEPSDLELCCLRREDGWSAELRFDSGLYTVERIERLADSLTTLLAAAAAAPETPAGELEILGEDEVRRLTVAWNATAADYPRDRCLHQLFADQVARTPEAVAVSFLGEDLSFYDLDRLSNRLGWHLRRLGVGPEARVALCAERSLEAIAAVLGILKAGGVYVPLDPGQPAERLALLLEDAGVAVLLTQERLLADLPAVRAQILCLDGGGGDLDGESESPPPCETSSENLAYIIYTSGSTGRPKGVMIPHRSAVHLATALRRSVYAGEDGPLRVSVNAPLAFDASIKQLVQLLEGHTVCMVPEEVRADGEAMVAYVRGQRLDVLDCTPSQLRLLLQAGLTERPPYPRLVLVGGEAVDAALWQDLSEAERPAFHNVYGPTECTVDATACRIAPGSVPNIGRPIANVRVNLLDFGGRPVPIGVPGEICIGGEGVGRGYLDRPETTAARFIPDSWSTEPGRRLYRTGDLARFLPDGRLEFLGRIDHQVKIRGFRIELGEIEETLGRHPAVAAAAVVLREGVGGNPRLVAYAVPRQRTAQTAEGQVRYRLPNGLAIVHQNKNETDYLYHEIWEKQTYLRYGIELPEGACVFDVGANIGMFTLFASRCRPGCRIYAFEPIGSVFEALRVNARLHGADVRLFRYGLSDSERREHFSYYPRYSMMSGLSEYADPEDEVRVIKRFLANERSSGSGGAAELLASADELLAGRFEQEIQEGHLRRLSDVIREEGIERIDLLKVDVQRAELDVLRGIDEEDWNRIEQVVMEVHDAEGRPSEGRLGEILRLLEEHGFEATAEQDELLSGTDRYNLYAVRPRGGRRLRRAPGPLLPLSVEPAEEEVSGAELRDFLRRQLPDYMMPSDFVLLDEMPLTRNGKVNRAALPAPQTAGGTEGGKVEAPHGPVEEILAAIWAGLLQHERIGADADFFLLGGHSLLVTQLVARAREAFGVEVPIRTVFEFPNLRGLAGWIERAAGGASVPLPPVERTQRDEPQPLSFAQERLWFLDQLEPGSPVYNNPFGLHLEGTLDPAALPAALAEVVRRHEVLRTVFMDSADGPRQVVLPAVPLELPWIDLSALPAPARSVQIATLQHVTARLPFDLGRGPLLRTLLLRLAPTEHLALLTLHHIVCDGWSMGLLAREVTALSEAFAAGRPSPLPELPVQYADFAVWQRRHLTAEALAAHAEYWRSRLQGAPPSLELPTDRPRPAAPSHRGARHRSTLPIGLRSAAVELGRERGATLFITLLAAFQALLSRWSGATDLSVGTPVAGRGRLEVEGLIGFFVNTLVLRGDLSGDPAFLDLLAAAREAVVGAHAHEALPFERLVDELQPERDLGRTPFFQVMLVLHNEPRSELRLPGLRVSAVDLDPGVAKFDLSLFLQESEEGLESIWEYSTDLFEAATVERFAGHWQTLLGGAIAAPGRRLSELPLLTKAERRQLAAWNDTLVDFPGAGFGELFAAQLTSAPGSVAVTCGERRLTYGELDSLAGGWAGSLGELGVGPEVVVGLLAERSIELLAAVLAVFEAGGAYLPLDPLHPPRRMAQVLARSGAPLVVYEPGLEAAAVAALTELAPERRPRLVPFDELVAPTAGGRARRDYDPSALAYVIFTSGSTGVPKGAMVAQQGMLNHLLAKVADLELTATDVVAQTASQCFDISVWQMLAALLVGGRIHVVPDAAAHEPARLLAEVERGGVTVLETVPSLLRALLEETADDAVRHAQLSGLRWMIPTGEALPPQLCRDWFAAYPGIPLLNAYGPTECSDDVSHQTIRAAPDIRALRVPIGRPLANTRLYVAGGGPEPAPVGVVGELWVAGVGVGRGYLGEPARTAEAFVPDPWGAAPGGRLYRTGDLVRRLADGGLEFLGRRDHQVKLRGFRLEVEEIEAVLAEHPAVAQAAVVIHRDQGDGQQLVGYAVCRDMAATADELRAALRQRLPEYMVPASLVLLAAMPLTANGKVDRAALPAPVRTEQRSRAAGAAPRTPTEELLAGIWTEVLGLDRVGLGEDFFALGGHSLLATRVVSRMRAVLGVELPLRLLFEHPTVAGLAAEVTALQTAVPSELPPLVPGPRDRALPLSFAQQRLWFLDSLAPGNPFYNVPLETRLSGPLVVMALAGALSEVVRRHEALRTRFAEIDGEPFQVIDPPRPVPLPVVDLAGLAPAVRERERRRLAAAEAARPFNLRSGPLVRAALLRLEAQEHTALLTLHHIVSDAWSTELLTAELAALYPTLCGGRPSPLPVLPIQYADFAQWQRRWLQGEALAALLAIWKRRLEGAPPLLELPTDRPRPAVRRYRGARRRFALPSSLSAGLRDLCRSEKVTPFMLFLAAFHALLGRHSGQGDVVVGAPIAGRNRLETEDLIGFFVNSLAMRADLSAAPSFRVLLSQVRAAVLEAHACQDLPFEKLVEELQPERSLSHSPLFQVTLDLHNASRRSHELPGLTVHAPEFENDTAKFDLTMVIEDRDAGLGGFLDYDVDLFDGPTALRLLGHYEALLAAMNDDVARSLAHAPLLSAAERHQLSLEWSDGGVGGGCADATVADLVAEQALRTPGAAALVFGGDSVTYRELDRRANRLAHLLRGYGVGPEVRVGVCLRRSLDLVVGLLGVLKAGGAYVPLDPAYPAERVNFLLEDSEISVLLTEERLAEGLPAGGPRLEVYIDGPEAAGECDQPPADGAGPGNAAYVLYTSGSTGRPKGVMVTHCGLINLVEAQTRAFGLRPDSRVLQFASFTFDASVSEILMALRVGATLYLAKQDALLPGPELLSLLRAQSITHVTLPPSVLSLLSEEDLPALSSLIVAGEACPADLPARWGRGRRFFNAYGPTEITVCATLGECVSDGRADIGRPISGVRVHILDPRLEPVPLGSAGELLVGGAGVARGYAGRPELTAERFIPDPFGAEPGARLYRTGDLARHRHDGTIEFLGRLDHQVKVRGFRIEPEEIEAALNRHPAVAVSVIVAREERVTSGLVERRLVAYLVLRPGETATVSALHAFLGESLPEYMVPATFVTLDELPLTSHGKVDLRALPAPGHERPDLTAPLVEPRSRAERLLAEIWCEVLRLDRVGVHDNFFDLGGDSILSLQIVARANQVGIGLTTQQIFQRQTIAALAEMADTGSPVAAEQGPVVGPLPLTPIQRWFFDSDPVDPHHFNQSLLLEVMDVVDPARFERVVEALLAHHDALRLRFLRGPEGWRQLNAPPGGPVPFHCIDLSALATPARSSSLAAAAAQVQASPDLAQGPLLRAVLFDLGPEAGTRLLLAVHHLAVDGVSWRILLGDLRSAWEQLSRGEAVALQSKTTSFKRWAELLAEHARSGALRGELGAWLAVAGRPATPLPVDHCGGPGSEASARKVSVALEPEETRRLLHEVTAASRARVHEVLLAAVASAFRDWTGESALLVEMEGHGREEIFDRVDLTRTIGWFTSQFPLWVDPGTGEDPAAALARVRRQVRAVPGRGFGYGLLRYLDDETAARLRQLPRPQVVFNYLGRFEGLLDGGSRFRRAPENAGPTRSPWAERTHLLEIGALVADGRLWVDWTYSDAAHHAATIERLADGFLAALRRLIAHGWSPEDLEVDAAEETSFVPALADPSAGELEEALREVEL